MLSTNDPSCLLEMTGREKGVGTQKDMDIMVLSEKFHLSLGRGEEGNSASQAEDVTVFTMQIHTPFLMRGK